MRTVELVTQVSRINPDWQVPTILTMLNEVQTFMLSRPLESRVVFDPSTGLHPRLVVDSSTPFMIHVNTDNGFPEDAILLNVVYSDVEENPVVGLVFREGTVSESAMIIFNKHNPPVDGLFVKYYKKPTPITNTRIELEIPERYHHSHVTFGVQAFLEEQEYGRSDKKQYFESVLCPKFWGDQNWNTSPTSNIRRSYDVLQTGSGTQRGYR